MNKPNTPDPVAAKIGQLCRGARKSVVQGCLDCLEAGKQLLAQKDKLGHGSWGPWLRGNQQVLGISERTAQRMIRTYSTWTSVLEPGFVLDEELATEISRDIWGNTTKNVSVKESKAASEQVQQQEPGSDKGSSSPPITAANANGKSEGRSVNAKLRAASRAANAAGETTSAPGPAPDEEPVAEKCFQVDVLPDAPPAVWRWLSDKADEIENHHPSINVMRAR